MPGLAARSAAAAALLYVCDCVPARVQVAWLTAACCAGQGPRSSAGLIRAPRLCTQRTACPGSLHALPLQPHLCMYVIVSLLECRLRGSLQLVVQDKGRAVPLVWSAPPGSVRSALHAR